MLLADMERSFETKHPGGSPAASGAAAGGLALPALALGLAALIGLGVPALLYDLQIPDEPRVAETSLAMARGGDLVVPTVNGKPFLQTPPLGYWVVGLWLRVVGAGHDGAVRIPSVLFSTATIFGLTCLLGRRAGRRAGILAGSLLLGTIGFWDAGHGVIVDVPLLFFTTVAFWQILELERGASRGAEMTSATLVGVAAGGAFLSKGLPWPGVIACGLLVALFSGGRASWRAVVVALGLALLGFLIVALPWTIALALRDPAAAWELLVAHVGRRALEGSAHDASSFAFLHRSLLKLLPLSALLAGAGVQAGRGWLARRRGAGIASRRAFTEDRGLARVLLVWLALPVLLLLLSRSKRNVYLLPAFPAAAALSALWLDRWWGSSCRLFGGFGGRAGIGAGTTKNAQRRWVAALVALPLAVGSIGGAYRVLEGDEDSFRRIGEAVVKSAGADGLVLGLALEEREEAAVAWYRRQPFEVYADVEPLAARIREAPRGVLLLEARDLERVRSALGRDAPLDLVGVKSLRRRTVQALAWGR